VDESREIELELMIVSRGVGALDFTKFALKTGIHHPCRLFRLDLANVAVVALVQEVEKDGEAVAILEAHSTSVADLECTRDFFVQSLFVPISIVLRVVAQPIGWHIRDRF
jgi:hypothetical protein